jgi:formate hydrogenlyase subunit 3/multisubunit Na+/H+ antiporter MnhD subunit
VNGAAWRDCLRRRLKALVISRSRGAFALPLGLLAIAPPLGAFALPLGLLAITQRRAAVRLIAIALVLGLLAIALSVFSQSRHTAPLTWAGPRSPAHENLCW